VARGAGNDVLIGGNGPDADFLFGDSGALEGADGAGNDLIITGTGPAFVVGDNSVDNDGAFAIGVGHDVINASASESTLITGDHNSYGSATGAGNDLIIGGELDDGIIGDSSPQVGYPVTGTGNDTIFGRGGPDYILGDHSSDGVESIATLGGNDIIDAGSGADVVLAGPGRDVLNGDGGSPDDCNGEDGTDRQTGCEVATNIP
jgi:Ca2+-binding RTX toxin-like protein